MDRRTLLKTAIAASSVSLPTPLRAAIHTPPTTRFPFVKTARTVLGHRMSLVDEGEGRPVVFLHGNPTSSYLWRNIMPAVPANSRMIAPDLIGMGDSEQPDIDYTYADHAAHLHGLLDGLDLSDAVLVIHDWGSALGLDWAEQNRDRVSAVAFMEAMLPPVFPFRSYEAMGRLEELFRTLRTEGPGEEMVLNQNFFVEEVLGKIGVETTLSEEVLTEYRAPYPTPASRKPTLQWPRQIPIGGDPAPVQKVFDRYAPWFMASDMPKLMLHVSPGALIPPPAADNLKANMTNLTAVHLGRGRHFIQEDYPSQISRALCAWFATL